jgi:predicted negative regulator of RcsB-dependent stress response
VDGLLTEKEQIEAFRGWWRENGRWIIAGVVLGAALLIGWNYWNAQKEESAAEASTLYESLLDDVGASNVEAAESKAAELYAGYDTTAYAGQARLAMARLYMSVGRDQDAADELAGLLVEGGDGELQMVGRLRLAKILLYQEKPQEVVDLLQGYGESAFAARYAEALGDANVQLGRYDEARDAYHAALADNAQAPTIDRSLVQMKLNDLPVSAPEAEPAPGTQAPDAAPGTAPGTPPEGEAGEAADGEGA